ncbi:50S ribosomal protein L34e [Candidatus Woesearchaeota archaeon]|nr:50S ribosomal protein L34e [Candidatus Woesearchaeota archaeon]
MTSQKFRSRRAFRRISKKVPGGATKLHFKRRKPSRAHCVACGRTLPGIPSMHAVQARTTAKTMKRPERPFGGVLCSPCARLKIIERAHAEMGE